MNILRTNTARTALIAVVISSLTTLSLPSFAGHKHHDHHRGHHHDRHPAFARVVSVTPVYQFVTETVPAEQCWTETITHRSHSRDAAPIVGGVLGAAIGNHVGRDIGHNDHHTRVGTIAGAVIGAAIGKDIARNSRRGTITEDVQRCETSYREVRRKEIIAYNVRYNYRGHIHHTRTKYHPGKRIEVDCNLFPRDNHHRKHSHRHQRKHSY